MKKNEIQVGKTYLAKVSDKVVEIRIDAENARGGWDATNLTTGKNVRIKSAQRLRSPAPAARRGLSAAAAARAERCDVNEADTPLPESSAHATASDAPSQQSDPDQVPLAQAMKAAKQPKEKKTSGLDAAHQVLADSGEPMRCGDVVAKMLATGMWKTDGKTPAATIYSAILREIQTKGGESRFKKTDRGLFTVNAQ